MTNIDTFEIEPAGVGRRAAVAEPKVTFGKNTDFQTELRRRVDDYFRSTGRRQRDCPSMYRKTAIILTCFAGCYCLLVFVAMTWWQALPIAILLGLAMAGIGFNIQHDGGHHAYSDRPWLNKLMAFSLDLVGSSSYRWHWKHGVFHHTYVNIVGHDTDIDLGIFGRVSPHQKRYSFHRWQRYYLWALYAFLVFKLHLHDDFHDLLLGRMEGKQFPRPRGWDLITFLCGKFVFLTLAFGIPSLFHPIWVVLMFYGIVAVVTGLILSVVFQVAHCVEEAEFPVPQQDNGRIENAWAIHQIENTVDFARGSPIAAWLLGGLNFQIEHHLFPRICHVNYPAISVIVEDVCRDFGVRYAAYPTFWASVVAHYRWLREMGGADTHGESEKSVPGCDGRIPVRSLSRLGDHATVLAGFQDVRPSASEEFEMPIHCDVVLQSTATSDQLKSLGAALWRWCIRAAGNRGIYQFLDNQGLSDLIAGGFPVSIQTCTRGFHFRARDDVSQDREGTIASLRMAMPAEGIEDILVEGISWNR